MPAPTSVTPEYELTIPSSGRKIMVRPFLVKEEKLLLMALQSNDPRDTIETTKQIVRGCILADDVNVDKLPFFDIDYMFVFLRAKSIGENITLQYTCGINECGSQFPAVIDISNVKMVNLNAIPDEVLMPGQIKVKLKYPTYTQVKSILDDENVLDKKIKLIAASIDVIQEKDKIYTLKDMSPQEVTTFVENLTQNDYRKFEPWVDTFPSFYIEAKSKCPKCGFEHVIEYTDLHKFF
jgi:hypothetical protein